MDYSILSAENSCLDFLNLKFQPNNAKSVSSSHKNIYTAMIEIGLWFTGRETPKSDDMDSEAEFDQPVTTNGTGNTFTMDNGP